MDIQAYIASGILEAYVLGDLSPAEAQEVERMAARYPEIEAARREAELGLESFARQMAVRPPQDIRARILTNIAGHSDPESTMPVQTSASRSLYARWAFAASVALAVLSTLAAILFFTRWQHAEKRLAELQEESYSLAKSVRTLEQEASDLRYELAVLADPAYKQVPLEGLDPAPEARAVVYWNAHTQQVYLHAGSLPEVPQDKQYQLWAIVDGQPVDMGVFDTLRVPGFQKMKTTAKASAFAVTLEPRGGSKAPTLEQMFVMGKVS